MKPRRSSPAARNAIDSNGRVDVVAAQAMDLTRCLSCRKLGAEDSGDNEVWNWKWQDGIISTMPRGLKPQLCVPCARAAKLDNGDNREEADA